MKHRLLFKINFLCLNLFLNKKLGRTLFAHVKKDLN